MGIRNLTSILTQKCALAITEKKLSTYAGMYFGIDTSIYLYKYLYNNGDHIEGLTRLTLRLLKNQIIPIFIFDGKPPKEKEEVLQERREKREYYTAKKNIIELISEIPEKVEYELFEYELRKTINNVNDKIDFTQDEIDFYFNASEEQLNEEVDKLKRKIIHINPQIIESAKKLFDLMGISYIHAPSEAEALIAYLSKMNFIHGCISEDTDVLVNGGKLFLRNVSADKNVADEYLLEKVLECLGFSYEQFIDMCILCGSDYTEKIPGMGPQTSYKVIQKYGCLESFLIMNQTSQKYSIPNNFDYVKARSLFMADMNNSVVAEFLPNITIKPPQMNELKQMLSGTSINPKYIAEIDKNLYQYYQDIQSLLGGSTKISESGSSKKKKKTVEKPSKTIDSFFPKILQRPKTENESKQETTESTIII